MFCKKYKEQLEDADRIISAFETMLNFAHLSDNDSEACRFCRADIKEYIRKWNS